MPLNLAVVLLICVDQMAPQSMLSTDHCQVVPLSSHSEKTLFVSWKHSVEKSEWQEIYTLEDRLFRLQQVQVQGSGAGMEIPPDAVLTDKHYVYYPNRLMEELSLTYSPFTPDYTLCIQHVCRFLFDWLQDRQPAHSTVHLDRTQSYSVRLRAVRSFSQDNP